MFEVGQKVRRIEPVRDSDIEYGGIYTVKSSRKTSVVGEILELEESNNIWNGKFFEPVVDYTNKISEKYNI